MVFACLIGELEAWNEPVVYSGASVKGQKNKFSGLLMTRPENSSPKIERPGQNLPLSGANSYASEEFVIKAWQD